MTEPLRFGCLFLEGDAGHTVPPINTKDLNLAATDVKYLTDAFLEYDQKASEAGINPYSQRGLKRIWRAERFAWWLTSIMHAFPDEDPIQAKLQEAEWIT